jgi:hypothetical protein
MSSGSDDYILTYRNAEHSKVLYSSRPQRDEDLRCEGVGVFWNLLKYLQSDNRMVLGGFRQVGCMMHV